MTFCSLFWYILLFIHEIIWTVDITFKTVLMEAVHHNKNEIFVFTLGIDCDIVHNNFSWEWTSLPTFTSYGSGPGHGLRSSKSTTKCTVCSNGSGTNRKRIARQKYFNITRINCLNIEKSKKNRYTANCSYKWTCFECTVSLLPFCNLRITFPQPERYEHRINRHWWNQRLTQK